MPDVSMYEKEIAELKRKLERKKIKISEYKCKKDQIETVVIERPCEVEKIVEIGRCCPQPVKYI